MRIGRDEPEELDTEPDAQHSTVRSRSLAFKGVTMGTRGLPFATETALLPTDVRDAAERPDLIARLAKVVAERAQQSLLRRLRTVDEAAGPYIESGGRRLLSFASNDYLGLSQHAAVSAALQHGVRRWGVGAGAAHLLGGHRAAHAALEHKIATWLGRDRALLFSTGYMANLGLMQALLGERDVCIQDKLNHASLLDAARLSGCELKRYRHADIDSASRQLTRSATRAALLATDGVFSMDGDICPLVDLAALCRTHRATLMIDDAHGIGVLGEHGGGSVDEADLTQVDVPILMGTLGKALGVAGAFVAGSASLIEGLLQSARTYIYTTALPPALSVATDAAIDIARLDRSARDRLNLRIAQFRHGATCRGIDLLPSRTPIQPLCIGSSSAALEVSQHLEAAGFFVPAIRPPTVAAGKARLRVTLSALHSEQDVERLLDALTRALQRMRERN